MSVISCLQSETAIKIEINDDGSNKDAVLDCINGKDLSQGEETKDINGLQLSYKSYKGKWTPGKRGRPPKRFSHCKVNCMKEDVSHTVNEGIVQNKESKHQMTNGVGEKMISKGSFDETKHTKEHENKNATNCKRVSRLQLKKIPRKTNTTVEEKSEVCKDICNSVTNSIVNGEEKCDGKNDDSSIKQSPALLGSATETPYRSRYGRLHKASVNPDMEFVPLIRKRNTPVKISPTKPTSETSEIVLPNSDQIATPAEHSDANASNNYTPVEHSDANASNNYTPVEHSGVNASTFSAPSEMNSPPFKKITGENSTPTSCKEIETLDSPPTKRPKLSSVDENSIMCEYLVGDLLWSKIGGHPWWPSMVSFDPLLGIYTKISSAGTRQKPQRIYHVQYFGREAERSWTVPNGCLRFEGRAKFDEYVEKILRSAPPKGPTHQKLVAKYAVKPSRKEAWLIAVEEAEDALKMTRAERKQQLTFEYTNMKKSVHNKVATSPLSAKRGLDVKSLGTSDEAKVKKQKSLTPSTPKPDSDVQNSKQSRSIGVPRRKKLKGQFMVFLQRHISFARSQHPDFSEEALEEYLHLQWDRMSEQERARYTSRLAVDEVKGEPCEKKGSLLTKEESPPCHSPEKTAVKEETIDDNCVENVGNQGSQSLNVEDVEQSDHSPSDSSSVQDPLDSDFCMSVSTRSEQACQICEKTDDVIVCKGPCKQAFHPDCLGLTQLPSNFQCDECTTGKHVCFACKQVDGITRKCSIPFCGKFYHEECVKNYPLAGRIEGRNMVCPLHACHACLADNPKQARHRSRLIRCIRCPTAYHPGDGCIAAGSLSISPNQIVCANHFQPKKGKQYQSRVNASWCFICSIGGSLICCESCPAAFHIECLEIDSPEGSYYCEDCEVGKHPRYGDIIWVKLGCYRWWPAKVCHPKSVPLNIQNMSHDIGEFPVEFFGSHDYYWIHRGRVFLFQDGDKGSKEYSVNRNLAKVFQRAVDEASEAYRVWQTAKQAKEIHDSERRCKPPFYKAIKFNKPVGKVQIPPFDMSRINRCECDPASDNPCGIDSDCLNRMTMFECHPNVCPAGERCQNQKFQKREYAPAVPFRTETRGWGLKALVDIKKGQFVNEYIGELIDEEECERRLQQMHEENEENFYFLTLDKERIIDAGPKGNQARFMNHSCLPNCETQKWTVNGDTRVGLFAIIDIPAGSELTFNYNLECRGSEKTKCCCGAPVCSGYIGIRPKTSNISQEKKSKDTTTRKRKRRQTRKHEDECFRCGEGGELVMCDRKSCPKSYHLNCLALTKPPYGRWECPWHHCDDCGKPSTIMCSECPNSFCKEHYVQEKIQQQDGRLLCSEHADDNSEISEEDVDIKENESKDDYKEIAFLCNDLVKEAAKSSLWIGETEGNGGGPINEDKQHKTH